MRIWVRDRKRYVRAEVVSQPFSTGGMDGEGDHWWLLISFFDLSDFSLISDSWVLLKRLIKFKP